MNNIEIILIIIIIAIIIIDRIKKKNPDSEELVLTEDKTKNTSLAFIKSNKLLIGSLALILACSFFYYFDYNKKFDEVEMSIENEDFILGRTTLDKLNNKLIKIKNLTTLNKEFNFEETYNTLNLMGNEPIYRDYAYRAQLDRYSSDQYDSIYNIYKNISDVKLNDADSLKYKDYNRLLIRKQLLQLQGMANLLINSRLLSYESRRNYRLSDDSNQPSDSIAISFISEYKRLRASLSKNINSWDEFTSNRIQFLDFFLDPSYENLLDVLSRNTGLNDDGSLQTNNFFSDEDTMELNYYILGQTMQRYEDFSYVNDKRIRKLFIVLPENYIYCYDCKPISHLKPIDFYLESFGLDILFYDYSDLKRSDIDKLVRTFNRMFDYRERYDIQFYDILARFSKLFSKKRTFEQIKLTSRLESNYSIEDIKQLSARQRDMIAGIYSDNVSIMWDKKDWRGGVKSTEKIIEIMDYENAVDDNTNWFSLSASSAYRNLWAMNFNIKPTGNKNNICDYLFKASQINPEDYYDEYLRKCN